MAKSSLHEMDRCTTIQGVRSMSMTQPVARDFLLDTCPLRRLADDPPNLGFIQMTAFATTEHRVTFSSVISQ